MSGIWVKGVGNHHAVTVINLMNPFSKSANCFFSCTDAGTGTKSDRVGPASRDCGETGMHMHMMHTQTQTQACFTDTDVHRHKHAHSNVLKQTKIVCCFVYGLKKNYAQKSFCYDLGTLDGRETEISECAAQRIRKLPMPEASRVNQSGTRERWSGQAAGGTAGETGT